MFVVFSRNMRRAAGHGRILAAELLGSLQCPRRFAAVVALPVATMAQRSMTAELELVSQRGKQSTKRFVYDDESPRFVDSSSPAAYEPRLRAGVYLSPEDLLDVPYA